MRGASVTIVTTVTLSHGQNEAGEPRRRMPLNVGKLSRDTRDSRKASSVNICPNRSLDETIGVAFKNISKKALTNSFNEL
jgi:hypothetical protein